MGADTFKVVKPKSRYILLFRLLILSADTFKIVKTESRYILDCYY